MDEMDLKEQNVGCLVDIFATCMYMLILWKMKTPELKLEFSHVQVELKMSLASST